MCQPWFYPRLGAYGYFWLSEGGRLFILRVIGIFLQLARPSEVSGGVDVANPRRLYSPEAALLMCVA